MKRVLISFLTLLFLLGLAAYVTYYQNPLQKETVMQIAQNQGLYTDAEVLAKIPEYIENGLIWDLLDHQKFFAWLTIVSLIFVNLVTFIHLLIDKLFFCKFFENPKMVPAIRRSFWVGLSLIGFVLLRLINGFYWYNAVSIVLLFVCIEILTINLAPKTKK